MKNPPYLNSLRDFFIKFSCKIKVRNKQNKNKS